MYTSNPNSTFRALLRNSQIRTLFKRIAQAFSAQEFIRLTWWLIPLLYHWSARVQSLGSIIMPIGFNSCRWACRRGHQRRLVTDIIPAPQSRRNLSGKRQTQDKAVRIRRITVHPAAIALITLAEPIIDILFRHGKFTFERFADDLASRHRLFHRSAVLRHRQSVSPNFLPVAIPKPGKIQHCRIHHQPPVLRRIDETFRTHRRCFGNNHCLLCFARAISARAEKRGYWNYTSELNRKILKICLCSLVMGGIIYAARWALRDKLGDWLLLPYAVKLPLFAGLCILGVATFCIMAKLTGVLCVTDIMKMLLNKGKKNAQNQA